MDRAEYRELMSQIKRFDGQGMYEDAADLIEEINWKRVKSASTLCSVAAILGKAGRYDEEKELLLMAYDRASIGRSILYELTENALRSGNAEEAKRYYEEYIETAPKDSKRYILQYKIGQAEGKTAGELISSLEELHEREFSEEWGYELARLYDECGEEEKCVRICDELAIYFGEGEYVDKALELKAKYQELSAQQRRARNAYHLGTAYSDAAAAGASSEQPFDASDLQKELAASLQQLKEAEDSATVEQTIYSVRKMVDESPLQIETPPQGPVIPSEPEEEESFRRLAEEADGQMGMEFGQDPEEVGGQLKIEDILAEWERTRADANAALEASRQSRLESAKASAVEQTQSIMNQIEGLGMADGMPPEEQEQAARQETQPQEVQPEKIPVQAARNVEISRDTREVTTAEPRRKTPQVQEDLSQPLQLTEDQKAQFTYFMAIEGMEDQICGALEVLRRRQDTISSAFGNVLIIGDKGCGKTMMASKLVKLVQKMYPHSGAKVGKINAASLNEKNIAAVVEKIHGGYLIIEDAGKLQPGKSLELSDAMDADTGGLLVVLEGTADEIEQLMQNGSDLGSKFQARINIPVMSSDELVAFAQCYANEENASLDEMAVLALYTKISAISKANHTTSLEEVKEIMDAAISKAARKNLSNTMRSIFSSRYDAENHLVLVEKDFD